MHLFGRPARIEELPELPVLEDAAGALGATHGGRACGSLGELGCFSFHPRKIVTTGEGGAVSTNDGALAERVRSLRHHGWSPSDGYDDMPQPAFNYRLSDVLCALGIPQLRRLDELREAYERVAAGYARAARRARRRAARGGPGRPPRPAGLRDPGRPPGRGDGRAARAGDPVPDRHVRAPPARRLPRARAPSRARTRPSSGRSRCRSTPGSPRPSSTGWRRRLTSL